MPVLILPTRNTSKSSTLIDHIYYYEGKLHKESKIKCDNSLSDISDHLPNYFLKLTDKNIKNDRPTVRLFSKKSREKFIRNLNSCDWSSIYASSDANISCNLFSDKIQHCFSESFPLVKLSRKRARDKNVIVDCLSPSFAVFWVFTRTVKSRVKGQLCVLVSNFNVSWQSLVISSYVYSIYDNCYASLAVKIGFKVI